MTLTLTASPHRLYTLDEFEEIDFPDHDHIYELIEGELVVTPPPGDEHGGIADVIARHVHRFDLEDKLGRVRQATRYQVAPGFAPAPDLGFVVAERLVPVVKEAVPTPPDLAVEVWSPHDLETVKRQTEARHKIRLYQTAGVPLVWVINPSNRTVEVYHPDQAEPVQILDVTGVLSGEEILPGFSLPVKALFE